MVDPVKEVPRSKAEGSEGISRNQVLQAIVFGLIFGTLLQKGGVAKYHALIGSLLLQDFTVFKVMGTAIGVAMIGIFPLARAGKIELKIKPTRTASVIIGSLLFGAGFACAAYCPGTGAAALGQMNYDALFMMLGMMAGAYFFAEASEWLSRTLDKVGDRGKIILPDLLHAPRMPVVFGVVLLLAIALFALEKIR
jgi:uncharacterized protein